MPTITANGCEFYYELGADIVLIRGEIHTMAYWD
jgi:hypothetical protein